VAIEFVNPLTAGTVLIRSDIRSQNYAAGSAGWIVEADGDAEFNSVTIRGGTVVGGTALYYSGTPAAGNLIMSISASSGTDAFGNAYVAGVGVYGASDKFTARASTGDTSILRADAPSGISETTSPGLELRRASGDVTAASITEFDDTFTRGLYVRTSSPLDISGSLEGVDYAAIKMEGRFHGSDPRILLSAGSVPDAPNGGIWLNGIFIGADNNIQTYADATVYTPAMGNKGTATFSTATGWWYRIGPMILFTAYFVCNGAGSGATAISITAPTDIDRTTRQRVGAHISGVGGPGAGEYTALCFTGGSGAVIDRITRGGTDLTGANILSGAIITVDGMYRELL
jgi:hypothetical protein